MDAQTRSAPPPADSLPKHIAIIMDGNGRWAKQRGLPREMGHKVGAQVFIDTVRYCRQIGIPTLTVYAFSTENWTRPAAEVNAIMSLFGQYLRNAKNYFADNARLHIIGDRSGLGDELCALIEDAEQGSSALDGINVNIAINYGGRDEILHAARSLAKSCAAGEISAEDIDARRFSEALYTAAQPDPDVIIRPSGEQRLSNFMLWQAAYAEFVYMDVLWPDFTPEHLNFALEQYAARNRRFGGV